MPQPQMLFVGNQGQLSYPAVGNAEIGSGSKGTIALWYHPGALDIRSSLVAVKVDSDNYLRLRRYKDLYVCETMSGGAAQSINSSSNTIAWRHIVLTWDFSGGAGNGVLRLYLDGQEVPESPVTTATAPVGLPDQITVGPGSDNAWPGSFAAYDQLAIWDDVMSAAQVSALCAKGRRHAPEQSEGSELLLFCCLWDGQFDADIAEGGSTGTPEGDADEYCRLDLGGRRHGQRFSYRLGMPAHDGSEDDRVPAFAVLTPGTYGALTATNTEQWAEVEVDASDNGHAVGVWLAPWLAAPTEPMTFRCALHLVPDGAPTNLAIGVGPLSYYHGDAKRFQCGSGCTTSTLTSSELWGADDYWVGAELSVLTGPAAGQKLPVLSYDSATKTITLDGALSDAPESSNVAVVEFPRRVEPFQSEGSRRRLECDLSQSYGGVERFSLMECAIGGVHGFFRVDRGRVQQYPSTITRDNVLFGKRTTQGYPTWVCTFLVERVEMDGPGLCQSTRMADDTFLVRAPGTAESAKVWRADDVSRVTRQPTQYSDPSAVQDEFTAENTWRHSLWRFPDWMRYDPVNDRLVALAVAEDAGGTARAGYVWGTWNEETGRVEWTDDPDPRNPLFELDVLDDVLRRRSDLYNRIASVGGVFQTTEGTWAMTFGITVGDPDGYITCALTGAEDEYSFDPAQHFHPEDNPLAPFCGARDKLVPEGGGIGYFTNRDVDYRFAENRHTDDASRRFWGYARAKTKLNWDAYYHQDMSRMLACAVTGDFKNLRNMPWRNTMLVPRWGWFHYPYPEWYSGSTLGLIVDDGGVTQSDVNLYVAEDGVHLANALGSALIPRFSPPFNSGYLSPVSNPVRLGNRRLYWYREDKSGLNFNVATIRLDGEALYKLDADKTIGELETSELRKPADGWSQLRLNVDPKQGQVRVAVVDTDTQEPIAGYGYSDCDALEEGVSVTVTWNEAGLSEVTADGIRLRFEFARNGAGDESPELYSWAALPPDASDRPGCSAPKVEGKTNPPRVADTAPDFSWQYEDPEGRPQSAFHLLVASSLKSLDENVGDLWDSGVVFSDTHEAKYEGAELSSETTYFWKVRVRNSEGVWSEEW